MYLRTTTLNTTKTMLDYVSTQEASFNKLSQQVSSGIRLNRISEDPAAARNILNINTQKNQLQAYLENMTSATQELKTLDSSLTSLSKQITNITDLATQAANGTYSNENMDEIKTQVDSLLETIVSVANTDYNGKYIFSGANTETQAYTMTKDATGTVTKIVYNGTGTDNGLARTVTISDGVNVGINVAGNDVFGEYNPAGTPPVNTGLFGTLMNLSAALGNHDSASVSNSLTGLNAAFDNTIATQTRFAAVTNKFDITTSSIETTMTTMEEYRSTLQDTDLATALTQLVASKTALQATYTVTSDLMKNVGLLNYL